MCIGVNRLVKHTIYLQYKWEHFITCWLSLWMFFYSYSKVKLATLVKGDPKVPFSIAATPRCRGGRYSIPGLLHFTLDFYLIMLSVKQGDIKYHYFSLWYDSTWDWTRSTGPLVNTLLIRPQACFFFKHLTCTHTHEKGAF